MISFTVNARPEPKGSPRTTFKGGYAHTYFVRTAFQKAVYAKVLEIRTRIGLPAFFHAPIGLMVIYDFKTQGRPAKGQREALHYIETLGGKDWRALKITRPDMDNLMKALQDEIVRAGLIYDDALICAKHIFKRQRSDFDGCHVWLGTPDEILKQVKTLEY